MLVFAHRGASGYAPENTLVAMDRAIALGAPAIEIDVQAVEDQLYVFHDRRLEKISTGQGVVHLVNKHYIESLSVNGEPIPTLMQLLARVAGRVVLNIELKGTGCVDLFLKQYPAIIAQYPADKIIVSSFNHPYLAKVKQQYPEIKVAPLLASLPLDGARIASQLDAYSIHLDISFINKNLVEDAHKRGVKVYVYTVDNPDDVCALAALGVDGIFSNYPDRAQKALENPNTIDYSGWFE
ncbi:glycerophosphodiester phosphodiesterase [Shewanella marina]|uniref:glycerophosphodiester phosphodiesterase n=1 Tax=Shewanella marina TaxID=487319 RepID=UPI00047203AF|nr:glycerophosphodiester phosphodiesterase [Shewanella marina]